MDDYQDYCAEGRRILNCESSSMTSFTFEATHNEEQIFRGECSYGPFVGFIGPAAVGAVIINVLCLCIFSKLPKAGAKLSAIFFVVCAITSALMLYSSLVNNSDISEYCFSLDNDLRIVCERGRYALGAIVSLFSVVVCGISIAIH